MLLETIDAQKFRNLSGAFEPGPTLNILVSENGQGKTNWLEAINLLATTRSFRTSRLQEAIAFDHSSAMIHGRVRESAEIVRDLRIGLTGTTKDLSVNGKKETVQRYLGQLQTVVFSADELATIRGLPEHRRRFMDTAIVSLHPPFVQVLSDYTRVIKQKNILLQSAVDGHHPLEKLTEMLYPWNEQLAKLATRIHRARTRYVERINEALERKLFGREELSIRYLSSLEGKGDLTNYEGLVAERLAMRVQAEFSSGHALVGPHRDDLDIMFDGHDIRKFGSAGQQRSALLLLQLANISVFFATRDEYPLFLIDDIDAELDYRRIGKLLEFLLDKTQLFVTTSKETFLERFGSQAAVFHISSGIPRTKELIG